MAGAVTIDRGIDNAADPGYIDSDLYQRSINLGGDSMKCPKCGKRLKVLRSNGRGASEGNISLRYECPKCGYSQQMLERPRRKGKR